MSDDDNKFFIRVLYNPKFGRKIDLQVISRVCVCMYKTDVVIFQFFKKFLYSGASAVA